jgi:ABC-type transporter Mla subunit MlaD
MRPTIRTDIHAINALDTAAEQLADQRAWDRTDLTYLQAMTELAATAHARITETIRQIAPEKRDWDAIAAALGTTPAQARAEHQPEPGTDPGF